MYEEKKIKIPFRDIALQILIIVLFVLILLWLFPTKKNMKKYVDNNNNNVENGEKQGTNNGSNNGTNNGSNNGTNNGSNNGTNNGSNNGTNNGSNNGNNTAKQYEYAKTSAGTYGDFGAWSEWSTKYVAASDTVEVETKTQNGVNGYKTYYVQNGTKTETAKIGTKTNNKVLKGYDVKFINTINSDEPLANVADYIYVLSHATIEFDCGGSYEIQKVLGTPITPDTLNYDYLITQNGNIENIKPSSGCANYKVVNRNITYSLYQAIPIYESVTEDVYGEVTTPVYEEKTDYSYGAVTYYRYRTRSYQAGTESIKWSNSDNDENLISQGYHFTGNVK